MLLNLTVNGRDAIDGAGTICIETANVEPHEDLPEQYDLVLDKPYVVLSVIDGAGILPGGVNFLQKPFTPDELASKVAQILNQEA